MLKRVKYEEIQTILINTSILRNEITLHFLFMSKIKTTLTINQDQSRITYFINSI